MKSRPVSLIQGESFVDSIAVGVMWNYIARLNKNSGSADRAQLLLKGHDATGELVITTITLEAPHNAYWYLTSNPATIVDADPGGILHTAVAATTDAHVQDVRACIFSTPMSGAITSLTWELVVVDGSNFGSLHAVTALINVQGVDVVLASGGVLAAELT